MKKFISGIIAGVMVTTSMSVIAATGVKTLQAHFSVDKLIVNGVDTGKGNSAFISNGTTYVPLRTISDTLGNEISWDSSTKTIYINSGGTQTNLGEPTDLPPVINNTQNTVTVPSGKKFITEQQAKNAAVKAVGGGTVIWIKQDLYDDDLSPDYEIKIKKGNRIYEVEVDAITGTVKDFEIDD